MNRFLLCLWMGIGALGCAPEAPVATPAFPTDPAPCFTLTETLIDFGTVGLDETPEPIEVHLESRCPERLPNLELDDPDGQFELDSPERIGNQWYFGIQVRPQDVGTSEAQIRVTDVQTNHHHGVIQVFVDIIEDSP